VQSCILPTSFLSRKTSNLHVLGLISLGPTSFPPS
jgi:hypothetical protein